MSKEDFERHEHTIVLMLSELKWAAVRPNDLTRMSYMKNWDA